MKNIFIVHTPFQLINALEAKEHFKTQHNVLLVLFTEFDSLNKKQIIDLINEKDWNEVISYDLKKNKNSKSSFFQQIRLIKKLRQYPHQYMFLGGLTTLNKLLLANLTKKEVFLIDDGAVTINHHQIELNPNVSEKIKLKKRIRQLRFNIFGIKTVVEDTINLFTCFKLTAHHHEKIIYNNFNYLKQCYFTDMHLDDKIYFLGQPLIQSKLMSEETFILLMKKVINYFDKPIIYIPHRTEIISDTFRKLENSHFIFQVSTGPIELVFLQQKIYPHTVASFFSTALHTLNIIYEKSDINAIVLPDESLLSNHKLIKASYDYISTTTIKKIHL